MLAGLLLIPGSLWGGYGGEEAGSATKVTRENVTMEYPGKIQVPEVRSFQEPAGYRNSYIFREGFEQGRYSSAFAPECGSLWRFEENTTPSPEGNLHLFFPPPREQASAEELISDRGNWIILGPFDLSGAREAHFNFYLRLGEGTENSSASLSALVSIDGVHFQGFSFQGRTDGWEYRNIDLGQVPHWGNVCGKKEVWLAFVPGSPEARTEGGVALDFLRLLVFNPLLPPRATVPGSKSSAAAVGHGDILARYAPYLVQELQCTEFGDYPTCFNYDGNYTAADNWDHLGIDCGSDCDSYDGGCRSGFPLPAYLYGSVIETGTHYFLCYAVFHPADDFHCNFFQHENDLEGIVMMVLKDGSDYGRLRMVQLFWHIGFYEFVPPGSEGIYETNDAINGEIELIDGHPVVYIEGGGHGLCSGKTGASGSWYVHYQYTGTAGEPSAANHTQEADPHQVAVALRVGYGLLPIAVEFWQRRRSYSASPTVFMEPRNYSGYRFSLQGLGTAFEGNSCMDGTANPPWWWSDETDNLSEPETGDWFLDSAWYHEWQFNWDETLDLSYTYHPFLYNHLGGEIYGTLEYFDSPPGPYLAKTDLTVPHPDRSLLIRENVEIRFLTGTKITASGLMEAQGSPGTILLGAEAEPHGEIRIDGEIRLFKGGSIRFP